MYNDFVGFPKVPVFARGDGSTRRPGEIPNRPLTQGKVWNQLKYAFYKAYPNGHIVRIEDRVGRGTPDVYFRKAHSSGWVEIKTGYQKPTALQLSWHEEERYAGGQVYVLTIRTNTCILEYSANDIRDLGVVSWAHLVSIL